MGCMSLCVPWQKELGLSQMPPQHEVNTVEICLPDLGQLGTSLSLEGKAGKKGERGISLASNNQVGLGVSRCKL